VPAVFQPPELVGLAPKAGPEPQVDVDMVPAILEDSPVTLYADTQYWYDVPQATVVSSQFTALAPVVNTKLPLVPR